MKRKTIVAGNWKMNKSLPEVASFIESMQEGPVAGVEVVIGCAYPFLSFLKEKASGTGRRYKVSAQNCHQASSGAFTGEVSAEMVASTGAEFVILGHSERRQYFGEDNHVLNEKIKNAINNGLRVIYCCGEDLAQRESGEHIDVVAKQIAEGLKDLSINALEKIAIAYEPIWAIGTGVTATAEQAEEMHIAIRSRLPNGIGSSTSILYGGSVKPDNFNELLGQENVDGALIGGASLSATSFDALIRIANSRHIQ